MLNHSKISLCRNLISINGEPADNTDAIREVTNRSAAIADMTPAIVTSILVSRPDELPAKEASHHGIVIAVPDIHLQRPYSELRGIQHCSFLKYCNLWNLLCRLTDLVLAGLY